MVISFAYQFILVPYIFIRQIFTVTPCSHVFKTSWYCIINQNSVVLCTCIYLDLPVSHAWDKVGWLTDWMLRDHGAHVTLCVMSVQVGLLPMVLPTTQVSDLYLAINNFLVFYLVFCEQLNVLFQNEIVISRK